MEFILKQLDTGMKLGTKFFFKNDRTALNDFFEFDLCFPPLFKVFTHAQHKKTLVGIVLLHYCSLKIKLYI